VHFGDPAEDGALRAFAGAFSQNVDGASGRDCAVRIDPLLVAPPGASPPAIPGVRSVDDVEQLLAARYDAKPGTTYLFRPDQHVCARWRHFDAQAMLHAVARATGNA
jgi:hypothetical protein